MLRDASLGTARPPLPLCLLLLSLSLCLAPAAAAAEDAAAEGSASQVATRFLELFGEKDLDAVSALFAPGAVVQRARLGDGAPEVVQLGTAEWAEDARAGIADVQDFKMEILDVAELTFEGAATVSVRFRATGRVGESTFFINDGVDSFSLTRRDGAWKIVLYNSFERLEFGR